MKVAILGYGDQGISAFEYWQQKGDEITICDSRPGIALPPGIDSQVGPDFLKNLDRFDLIVRAAPSIHPRSIVEANTPGILKKVTSNTNEFFRVCPTKHIIGITGTKGKGTTSTLVAKMLEASGKHVHLGGNIGIAPLELLRDNIQPDDWVVLELANFQLIDIVHSSPIAVCLMIVPEHLNWHPDMEEYVLSKAQLFKYQKPEDVAIYFAENDYSREIANYSPGHKVPYFSEPGAVVKDGVIGIDSHEICHTNELKLLGTHNWQNACAAVTAAWQVTQDIAALRSVLTTFTGLEHRIEFIRGVGGISYYDDSFGSTPETAMVAIEALKAPKVIILGGSDKGVPFDELAHSVTQGNVRHAVLIGETAPKIEASLRAAGFDAITPGGKTMLEIVKAAQEAAQSGDVVLLSPACASFDMFQNYKDRAAQYVAAVNAL